MPLAFDAFEMMAKRGTNIRQLVIYRNVADFTYSTNVHDLEALALSEETAGVWALRGVRNLQQLSFQGYKPINQSLRATMQCELKGKRPRTDEEEGHPSAQRWRARDSAIAGAAHLGCLHASVNQCVCSICL